MTAAEINQLIKQYKVNTNDVSDGYHTFGELYEHRIVLFITLARLVMQCQNPVSRSYIQF